MTTDAYGQPPTFHILKPDAHVLVSSMRCMGYNFEAAIADILDNSISAGAKRIQILSPSQSEHLAIIDDGHGMTRHELIDAMRFGARSPLEERAGDDLGRFGLGMKTASLSQCRRVTVVSRKDGETTAARWDLDTLQETSDWTLELLDPTDDEILELKRLPSRNGTLVLWEHFDRFGDRNTRTITETLRERLAQTKEHIGRTFHRFLSGDAESGIRRIEIILNGAPIEAIDPFANGQTAPSEVLHLAGHKIPVRIVQLSHENSDPSASSEQRKEQREKLRQGQGFYLYRNFRLIAHGTWFRTRQRRADSSRFTRIMLDIPSAVDDAWNIDVRKSFAEPPAALRRELQRLADTYIKPSEIQHHSRARTLPANNDAHPAVGIWRREQHRDGIRYVVNDDHPLVDDLRRLIPVAHHSKINQLLTCIERSLQVSQIHDDYQNNRDSFQETQSELSDLDDFEALVFAEIDNLVSHDVSKHLILKELLKIPPYPQLNQSILAQLVDQYFAENDL